MLYLSVHWGELIEQIKKICHIHFKDSSLLKASRGRMTNDSDCTLWNFSRNHMESSRINLKCMIIFSMAETLNELKQFLAES